MKSTIETWYRPKYYQGEIDDFQIYDRELTKSEIKALFNGSPKWWTKILFWFKSF